MGTVNNTVTASNAQGVTVGTGNGDHIAGTTGNDSLYGTGGNDLYYGNTGNDSFVISAASLAASSATTNNITAQAVIYDFGGAGGWSLTNNDFIALTGFGSGSTISFDHYGQVGGVTNTTTQFYTVHDTTTGANYTIYVHSLDGKLLGTGDYAFY